MRPIELPDRYLMRDEAAKTLTGKPGVQVKGRGLDLERRLAQLRQVEVDRMIGRRAYRGRDARKHRQCCAMDVAGRDKLDARMTPDDRRKLIRIEEILPVHVPDAGLERRMMQKEKRRFLGSRCERSVQPFQCRWLQLPVRLAGHA